MALVVALGQARARHARRARPCAESRARSDPKRARWSPSPFSKARCVLKSKRPICADFKNQISQTRHEATTKNREHRQAPRPRRLASTRLDRRPWDRQKRLQKRGSWRDSGASQSRSVAPLVGGSGRVNAERPQLAGCTISSANYLPSTTSTRRSLAQDDSSVPIGIELAARRGGNLRGGQAFGRDCGLHVVGATTAEHHVVLFFTAGGRHDRPSAARDP